MLDQPSQVYFPPEKDIDNTGEIRETADDIAVKQMFDFIIDTTIAMQGGFQIIITDHAYLKPINLKNTFRKFGVMA